MNEVRIYIHSLGNSMVLDPKNTNSSYNYLNNIGFDVILMVNYNEFKEYQKVAKENNVKVNIITTRDVTISRMKFSIFKHALSSKLKKIIISDDNLSFYQRVIHKNGSVGQKKADCLSLSLLVSKITNLLDKYPQVSISNKKESYKRLGGLLTKNNNCKRFIAYDLELVGKNVHFCRCRYLDSLDINLQMLSLGFKNIVIDNFYYVKKNNLNKSLLRKLERDYSHCAEIIHQLHPDCTTLLKEKIGVWGSYKTNKRAIVDWGKAYKKGDISDG